jgi:glycosyltransferase involved in cell wall biosynthesis
MEKKIVHIILGKANPQRMNGVNKVVYELATNQANNNTSVEVWGMAKDTEHNYPERNFKTRLFQAFKNPFKVDLKMIEAMKNEKNTIFHFHGGFIPVFSILAKKMNALNIPFVLTPHGAYNTIAMEKSKLRKKIYFALFEKHVVNNAAYIHSIGKSEVEGLSLIYPNTKSILIPYGFDTNIEMHYNPSNSKFIVGFCGRIDVYTKGLNELIEGFAMFRNNVANAELWMIGDGDERGDLEQLARDKGVEDSVIFYGSKYGNEKIDLLSKCHVYAAPSRNEGLPAAVLEAASIGIPCMVTEATNTGDSIREFDAGAVIAPTASGSVYDGLVLLHERMKDQKSREQLSDNSRRMINEVYNWKNVLSRFDALYHKAGLTT